MDLAAEQLRTISRQDDRLALVLPKLVTAVVASSDLVFGVTRMWRMLMERPGWSTRAFLSMTEAEAWLREVVHLKFAMELPQDLNMP